MHWSPDGSLRCVVVRFLVLWCRRIPLLPHRYVCIPGSGGYSCSVGGIFLIRDTPQSCGLPTIEKYRNDYPKNYSEKQEEVLTAKEIFFKHVFNNKMLWYIAIANAFVYMVRYGCLDWAPTFLKEAQGYDIKQAGWAYFAYEFAAIPGTLVAAG